MDQIRIWCAVVALAAWTQLLALAAHAARRLEPKRLRLLLFSLVFSLAGRLARAARRIVLHLAGRAPWATLL